MRNGEATGIDVLIERKQGTHGNLTFDLKEIAGILASSPYRNPTGGGILHCLGYREERSMASPNISYIDIIFQLPELTAAPRTLRDLILEESRKHSPLDYKIRLARQLCDTILAVFTSGLVHKSIRTDTILLLPEKGDNSPHAFSPAHLPSSGFGNPYLTSWSLLRKATGLTSGPGPSGYLQEFYRHPKRQGIQPEQRYNIGHDIYSLGVCFLEISLWEPFFTKDRKPSRLYRDTALKLGCVKQHDTDNIQALTTPWIVAKVLKALAENEVPQLTGLAFSNLVVSCLTCLEGGMGDPECFKRNSQEAAVRFNEFVSQSFAFSSI